MSLSGIRQVQSQIAFNLLLIWTVTGETFLTEDGGDVLIKIDSRRMQEPGAPGYRRTRGVLSSAKGLR